MAVTVSQINEVKKLLEAGKLHFGADQALKLLRAHKAVKVWISKNVEAGTLADIKVLAGLDKIEVVEIPYSGEEMGTMCRKPFAISVLSSSK